jgi:hypothetical protein
MQTEVSDLSVMMRQSGDQGGLLAKLNGGMSEKDAIETKAIDEFIAYLKVSRGATYTVTGREVVVDRARGTNYDFELAPEDGRFPKMAVDVFQLFDSEGAAEQQRKQGYYWAAMKSELVAADLGPCLVSVPHDVAPIAREAKQLAKDHVKVIKNAISMWDGESELLVGMFRVVQIAGLTGPALGTLPHAGWVNPKGSLPQFEKGLAKKNSQLAVDDHERVVVVVNRSMMVDPDDAVRVVATMDTSTLTNIDKLFFGLRSRGFQLVYDREVRDSFATTSGPAPGEVASALLNAWLQAKLSDKDDAAVRLIRRVTDLHGNMNWLDDRQTRTQFVYRVGDLVAEGDIDLGLWAIERLVADHDPPLENYPDDPTGKWNSHQQVLNHQDNMGITTVRGSLAWVLQKLVVKSAGEHTDVLVAHAERLGRDPNAYVRMQAAVPLIELSIRRRCVGQNGEPLYTPEQRARIRSLVMDMLRENAGLPRVLDWLAHAVVPLRDLSEEEATWALALLLPNADGDGLADAVRLLALCAEYTETVGGRPFNSTRFRTRLAELAATGPADARSTLAFQVRQQFENDLEGARRLLPYVCLLASGPHADASVLHHVLEIAECVFATEPNETLEAAVVEAVESVVRGADRNLSMMVVFSALPVLESLGNAGRWESTLRLARAIAEAQAPVLKLPELVALLGKTPDVQAAEARSITQLLQSPGVPTELSPS